MKQYHDFLKTILEKGVAKQDRTGTGTQSYFGHQMRFDLSEGFPLVTTKKVHLKSIVHELIWFLKGDTNIQYLKDHNVSIWDEWADEQGNLGPIYGEQWRKWKTQSGETVDQIQNVIDLLKKDPDSRRMIVSAWNVGELNKMSLMPCHAFFQFYMAEGRLSCQLYQRSADAFLGVPFNIASYALLIHMIAQQIGAEPGELIWTGGDCHIYNNHKEQVATLLSREPYPLPTLELNPRKNINDYVFEDVVIKNYQCHSALTGQVAV